MSNEKEISDRELRLYESEDAAAKVFEEGKVVMPTGRVLQQLRKLSAAIPEEEMVGVPEISPDKWLDGTIEKPENVGLNFVDVSLSRLLHFIADMLG